MIFVTRFWWERIIVMSESVRLSIVSTRLLKEKNCDHDFLASENTKALQIVSSLWFHFIAKLLRKPCK